jgi:Domain of unknown function DUF29
MKYDEDLYRWTVEQADALRRRAVNDLDYDNLAEEIESVGRSERREIRSRLKVLLIHLLKWRYQPEKRSDSWRASVSEARQRIEDVLTDSPSLRSFPTEALASAYRLAIVDEAVRRLELLHLPEACPWTIEEVLRGDFWP